jgi:hypothetical protein
MACFGDKRVSDLLAAARQAGLRPQSDAEPLPLLLRLLGACTPVGQWPTQMTGEQRARHARESARGHPWGHTGGQLTVRRVDRRG